LAKWPVISPPKPSQNWPAEPERNRTYTVTTRCPKITAGGQGRALSPGKQDALIFGLVWVVIAAASAAVILLSPS
jgi:hypothetical protein